VTDVRGIRARREALDALDALEALDAMEAMEALDATRNLRDPRDAERTVIAAAPIEAPPRGLLNLSFQARLAILVMVAALVPLLIFGVAIIVTDAVDTDAGARLLLFAAAVTFVVVLVGGYVAIRSLTAPLRDIADAVERVGAGDPGGPISVPGDDAFARLAESHNRLAGDIERRDRELGEVLSSVETASPRDGVERFAERAARGAAVSFGLLDARIILGPPDEMALPERVPGMPLTVRAEVRAGTERLGVVEGRLPAMRRWERADQALLDLFAREIGVALRNAQLFAQVEAQYVQLRRLGEAKDDFLRGVSHNLQTPLTTIRAQANQLRAESFGAGTADADRRLAIIAEQAGRLTRMVQQLLLVSRLESGPLRPRTDVLALATRVRRAWEAFGASETRMKVTDRSAGWLAIGDADHLDQVLWALLDNAVKYGAGPIAVDIGVDEERGRLLLTIADHGPGISPEDGARLFRRFTRGPAGRMTDGSGLGLYVSRELMRGMGGDLRLEPPATGQGAAFTLEVPAEHATEA
jgi:signal transduction histidine kinase/HAMP domain-containing protein